MEDNRSGVDLKENRARMLRGELYFAFVPDLTAERTRCEQACIVYNDAKDLPRRKRVELWRQIVGDESSLPQAGATADEDEVTLEDEPYIMPPIHIDYGTNTKVGRNVFINFNCTILDTCQVSIGARTLIGPNVSFYSGTHPLDPVLRNGTKGPELGKEIVVGEDCWIGGNVTILPGVSLGRGAVIGAGSVVTKSVPEFWVAAGNPARLIRKIETQMDPEFAAETAAREMPIRDSRSGAEVPMAQERGDIEYHDDEQGW